jgi:hypothetical protein
LDELSETETVKINDNVKHLGLFFAFFSRGDGKRFVVRADEKLTAFLELEAVIQSSLT